MAPDGNALSNIIEHELEFRPVQHVSGTYEPSQLEDIEAFLVTLPGYLIEPVAMSEILAILHGV